MRPFLFLAILALLLYFPLILLTLASMHSNRFVPSTLFGSSSAVAKSLSEGWGVQGSASAGAGATAEAEKQLEEVRRQLNYLETKVNAYLAFGTDPFRGMRESESAPPCEKKSYLDEYYCKDRPPDFQCVMDHNICLDDLLPQTDKANEHTRGGGRKSNTVDNRCVVYDFGIRDDPAFGEVLAGEPFRCDVFAFDPSPVTSDWYENSPLQNRSGYKLFPFGAGGRNGDLTLREYNWDQITILQYPEDVVDPGRCDDAVCKYRKFPSQKQHRVPVRTLKSVMDELGHERIAVLKLDVEGSEYSFLEAMIEDLSCRAVDQVALEWHHHGYDTRYGIASSPHINVLVTLLEERCGLYQSWLYDHSGGWPANDKLFLDMGMTLRYNLASFRRKDTKKRGTIQ